MTDEQLRAALRRVLALTGYPNGIPRYDTQAEIEAAAVAIMREGMADERDLGRKDVLVRMGISSFIQVQNLRDHIERELGIEYRDGDAARMLDDPTQSFVATTDAMQQSIARTIEGT